MKENEPIIAMVHTLIENSALRPQLYQQVRSWTVNDTALSSAEPLSDSFGLSSELLITLVFLFHFLFYVYLEKCNSSMLFKMLQYSWHGFAEHFAVEY